MNDAALSSRKKQWAVVVIAIGFPSLVTLAYFVWLAGKPSAWQQVAFAIGKVLQFGFPVFWVFVVLGRRPKIRRPDAAGLVMGLLFGGLVAVAMFALAIFWLRPAGLLDQPIEMMRQKLSDLGINSFGKYLALGIFYSLAHSFLEEYYWRWFVFGQLREMVSVRWAILISSLGFMAHHIILLGVYFGWSSSMTWLFSSGVAVGGAVWAWLYHRTGTLYAPWLSHLVVDAAIFSLGYLLVGSVLAN
ncbi:MAG: CPBP family intramembrane glutamic endopeptidase [Pirellulaceae bacterium]